MCLKKVKYIAKLHRN